MKLPTLPSPRAEAWGNSQEPKFDAFDAGQMREYGEACARLAPVVAEPVAMILKSLNDDFEDYYCPDYGQGFFATPDVLENLKALCAAAQPSPTLPAQPELEAERAKNRAVAEMLFANDREGARTWAKGLLYTSENGVTVDHAAPLLPAPAQSDKRMLPLDSEVVKHGKYDDVLHPFLLLMERELHANSGKGDRPGWLSMSPQQCLLEIYYHVAKLQKAVKNGEEDGVTEYAADVANMAMMLVDIYVGLCTEPGVNAVTTFPDVEAQ